MKAKSLLALIVGALIMQAPMLAQQAAASGLAGGHHDARREAVAAARSRLRRGDQGEGVGIERLVGPTRRAAEGCAQRAARHDGRRRLRRAWHVRRRHPDTRPGSHREQRAALHELPRDRDLLADPRGPDHRAQPPRGRLRRGWRSRDRLPRLQLDHPERERDDRHDPEAERVRDLVVRQEPQHAVLSGDAGRAVRSVAQRHGLRVLLRLHGRRCQPVGAEPLPQHDRHLPLRGHARLEPDHGHGGRGDPVHEGHSRRSRPRSRSWSITCRAARMPRTIPRPSGSTRSAT